MDEATINKDAHRENVRALMAAANIAEEEATSRLTKAVLVTCGGNDQPSKELMEEIIPLLSKTLPVSKVIKNEENYGAELVFGGAKARTDLPKIFAVLREGGLIISQNPVQIPSQKPLSRLLTLLAACYATGAVIGLVVGEADRAARIGWTHLMERSGEAL